MTDPDQPSCTSSPALSRVLRPLVRLALSRGVTYPALAEMLKKLFVEVARSDFALEENTASDSRIHLLTGIHRKEIKRLREETSCGAPLRSSPASLGAQLVGVWLGRAPYADPEGGPRPLPRLASVGGEASFESLVAGVSKDIRSRAVLDEWLRQGMVSLNDQDEVVLNVQAFVPQEDFTAKAHFFALNLHDHAAAAVHNLLGEGAPWLERSVHYDALSAASVSELNALAHQHGMVLLQTLNSTAQKLEARDAPVQGAQRFTCGVYFFSEPVPRDENEKS